MAFFLHCIKFKTRTERKTGPDLCIRENALFRKNKKEERWGCLPPGGEGASRSKGTGGEKKKKTTDKRKKDKQEQTHDYLQTNRK